MPLNYGLVAGNIGAEFLSDHPLSRKQVIEKTLFRENTIYILTITYIGDRYKKM